MAKFFRKKSKRMSCKKRYKIEKKVREHRKKMKKEMKKKPPSRKKKDPGVPNSLPFKQQVLEEAIALKQQALELKEKQKEERRLQQMESKDLSDSENEMSETKIKEEEIINKQAEKSVSASNFYREFNKVVEASDVILEVLDARDPLGTRSSIVENAVLNSGGNKKLVIVLNKIDLVPRENLLKWIKYLRNEFPTVAFKASTQNQKENLGRSKVAAIHVTNHLLRTSQCIGANFLMKLLGNYCKRDGDVRASISVGIVGLPNVGKSSIINSLKRSRACTVGSVPGITKNMQVVQLDKHIKLLDAPGLVMASESADPLLALRNAVKIESIQDPMTPAEIVVQRANKEQLMLHYRVSNFSTPQEFFAVLALRIGQLKKGGIPNVNAAARKVLNDWNSGRIKYYTHPPEEHIFPSHIQAEYVSDFSKQFDLDSMKQEEDEEFLTLPIVNPNDAVLIDSSGLSKMNVDQMSDSSVTVAMETGSRSHSVEVDNKSDHFPMNKKLKIAFKKEKKKRKKNEKTAKLLSECLENAFSTLKRESDYNFGTDYV